MTHAAVVTSGQAAHRDPATLGGKAANLARLTELGFRVPPWFVVPTEVFVSTMAACRIDGQVRGILEGIAWDVPAAVRKASADIAALIKGVTVHPEARAVIAEAYHALGGRADQDPLVAVRSSAVGEDSAANSFAGQLDTFLFVRGDDAVLCALAGCWASGFSERALAYRHRNGLDQSDIRVAVVVQEMVFGEVSGVLFTANAITNNEDEAVLSATYGLGEGLVSGELDADSWIVERATRKVVRADIANKAECIVLDTRHGFGTAKAEVVDEARERACLDDSQIASLVDLGERIAAKLGSPQDIEWTIREGTIYLLQTRPITTLKPRPRGYRRLWDNSNIAESYYGVTTPLTFSFVNRMYEVAYQVLFDAFGIPQRVLRDHQEVFANLLGLLNGRIFYNLGNYYKIITFLPAYDYMKDFFDTMIGVQERKDYEKKTTSWFGRVFIGIPKIAYLVGRIFGNFLAWDKEVATFSAQFDRIFEDFRRIDYANRNPDEILATYRTLERDLLWEWRAPMTNDFFAMVFFGLLKRLTVKWGIDTTGSLHNDLLCGEGGLESTQPAKALIRLAVIVRGDAELRRIFETTPEGELARLLSAPGNAGRFKGFRDSMQDYLDRYGYRCMGELKLEVKNLIEDPTFVYAMVKNYLHKESLDLAEMEAKEREIRRRAEQEASKALAGQGIRQLLFSWILYNARKGVRHRENLRMARTKAFGLVRQMFQGLGVGFAHLGVLDHADDVFYLDLVDCFAFVEGRATTTNLKALVALRKEEFAAFEALPVSDRFETVGPVYYGDQLYQPATDDDTDDGPVLHGTSCCPGRVAARVKVILRASDDMRLAGEILVTERTDPGWVPLYPSASGLLIERGSLLSHAAVVARELGLPTIIGVKNLIKRLRDGEWVDMDARAGTVRLDAVQESAP